MGMAPDDEIRAYNWVLPEGFEVPPDELLIRLDYYHDTVIMHSMDGGVITTKMVSARAVTMALMSEISLKSGLLPEGTLYWGQGKGGAEVGLWRPPKVWKVALQEKAFTAARRLSLPMPGLIFVCSSGRSPSVYAAKRRPRPGDRIYHAPLFNLFNDGRSCAGTHKYSPDVRKIPEEFFTAFFTVSANYSGRSKRYPADLLGLWNELNGQKQYPLDDLVSAGKVEDLMK